MLRNFWPQEKIATWEAVLFLDGLEQNGNDSTVSLISLSPDAHVYWNKGQFALKPISASADSKTLTVQFFWQAKQSVVMPKTNLATIPLSTRDLDRYGNNALYDGSQNNYPKIESGQLFEITTDNLEVRPLPGIALLENVMVSPASYGYGWRSRCGRRL
jgi:hypothetical protein